MIRMFLKALEPHWEEQGIYFRCSKEKPQEFKLIRYEDLVLGLLIVYTFRNWNLSLLRSNSKSWFFWTLSDLREKKRGDDHCVAPCRITQLLWSNGRRSPEEPGLTSCWSPLEWNDRWRGQRGKLDLSSPGHRQASSPHHAWQQSPPQQEHPCEEG